LAAVAGSFLAQKQVIAPSLQEWRMSFGTKNDSSANEVNLPSDFSKKIIEKINSERVLKNLGMLQIDENLNKAAKARLSVIVAFGDYEGSASALTRDKALSLVGYDSTVIGDVFFSVKSTDDNYLDKLLADKVESETILLSKFSDVGISEYKTKTENTYYLIFGNKQKKVSTSSIPKTVVAPKINWGGPDLWEAVNKRRTEFGVGQLSKKDELCTIASIRLNQLLELKKLDGHAGFQPVLDRSDLKWIGEKYNISEFLAQGFDTPTETVKGWENTLGHRSLLTGGEFVWGCVYAQNTFAVAITAY